ncbi:hypothetical protein WN51_10998 [Melipona quadrifasciata]|uniref:EH domain-containing protein n=1 Tax=Melipona quadrifasciata TaxID=166423 RepID=A0A0N0BIH9_9HYME|nr:hypothetical protein WN51_10998 [Melipona quadrifasciata]
MLGIGRVTLRKYPDLPSPCSRLSAFQNSRRNVGRLSITVLPAARHARRLTLPSFGNAAPVRSVNPERKHRGEEDRLRGRIPATGEVFVNYELGRLIATLYFNVAQLLKLDEENEEKERAIEKNADVILKELKRVYDNAIQPLESLYKYRDLSNRHFGGKHKDKSGNIFKATSSLYGSVERWEILHHKLSARYRVQADVVKDSIYGASRETALRTRQRQNAISSTTLHCPKALDGGGALWAKFS